jgi:hypothetical protein
MHIHSHKSVLNPVNYGVRLCAVCSMRCVWCAAVQHSNSCSVRQFAEERTAVCGSAAVCTAVCAGMCGSPAVRAAVCGSLAVSISSNQFKTYSHKFV